MKDGKLGLVVLVVLSGFAGGVACQSFLHSKEASAQRRPVDMGSELFRPIETDLAGPRGVKLSPIDPHRCVGVSSCISSEGELVILRAFEDGGIERFYKGRIAPGQWKTIE